jgi:hypothetical protein
MGLGNKVGLKTSFEPTFGKQWIWNMVEMVESPWWRWVCSEPCMFQVVEEMEKN